MTLIARSSELIINASRYEARQSHREACWHVRRGFGLWVMRGIGSRAI
jgi:hypothetical protein